MIRFPSSLSGRLLLAATIFIALTLVGVAALTDVILDRFVHRQIDQQLDAQVLTLTTALKTNPDGHISLTHDANGPPFDQPLSGWYWEVAGAKNALRSLSLRENDLQIPAVPLGPPPPLPAPIHFADGSPPFPADGPGPQNESLHYRVKTLSIGGQVVTIAAAAPDDAFTEPLHSAMTAVLLALGLAAVALIAAMYFQVRLGLRPLEKLKASIADIRAGRAERLPGDQPSEIAPVVEEINKLVGENAEGLVRARRNVANLAHGLKTPLANLGLALQASDRDPTGELLALVTLMDRRIRHHLSRARVAALGGPARATTHIAPRVSDIVSAMSKIHADRRIAAQIEVPPDAAVGCEPQDFDEMLGNLIDNAFKWAKSRVRISAQGEGDKILLRIEDDGAGLADDAALDVLRPGRRLDESAPGYGFGLPITRELAELYGGSLTLAPSNLGGLTATLTLPAAHPISS
jgi:signal transduction histidine kinase